jgi:ribosomal protein L37E
MVLQNPNTCSAANSQWGSQYENSHCGYMRSAEQRDGVWSRQQRHQALLPFLA